MQIISQGAVISYALIFCVAFDSSNKKLRITFHIRNYLVKH